MPKGCVPAARQWRERARTNGWCRVQIAHESGDEFMRHASGHAANSTDNAPGGRQGTASPRIRENRQAFKPFEPWRARAL